MVQNSSYLSKGGIVLFQTHLPVSVRKAERQTRTNIDQRIGVCGCTFSLSVNTRSVIPHLHAALVPSPLASFLLLRYIETEQQKTGWGDEEEGGSIRVAVTEL